MPPRGAALNPIGRGRRRLDHRPASGCGAPAPSTMRMYQFYLKVWYNGKRGGPRHRL